MWCEDGFVGHAEPECACLSSRKPDFGVRLAPCLFSTPRPGRFPQSPRASPPCTCHACLCLVPGMCSVFTQSDENKSVTFSKHPPPPPHLRCLSPLVMHVGVCVFHVYLLRVSPHSAEYPEKQVGDLLDIISAMRGQANDRRIADQDNLTVTA